MIIGLSGKAGSGKTTFADVAVSDFGFTKLSFANGVKQEVKEFLEAYDIPVEDRNLWGTQADKEEEVKKIALRSYLLEGDIIFAPDFGCTFRHLLQFWGTDYRRRYFGEDYWTKKLLSQLTPGGRYVVDDLRFPNEAEALKERGGLIIKIIRNVETKVSGMDHPSETVMDNYDSDVTVFNTADLEAYKMRAALTLYRLQ